MSSRSTGSRSRPPARSGRDRKAQPRRGSRATDEARSRGRSRRRLVAGAVTTVLLVGVLFVGVFPTRTFLAQRAATQRSAAELAEIREQQRRIDRQIARQQTDEEIERQAREDGYVKPGEEAYSILPTRTEPLGLPEGWPFTGVEQAIAAG